MSAKYKGYYSLRGIGVTGAVRSAGSRPKEPGGTMARSISFKYRSVPFVALCATVLIAVTGCPSTGTTSSTEAVPPATTAAPTESQSQISTGTGETLPSVASLSNEGSANGANGAPANGGPANGGPANGGPANGGPANGGPLSPDAAAVQRINAQFVPVDQVVETSYYTLSGSQALSYIQDVANFAPELNSEFSSLLTGASCALKYGVVGAKAYVAHNYTEAGAIVVLF